MPGPVLSKDKRVRKTKRLRRCNSLRVHWSLDRGKRVHPAGVVSLAQGRSSAGNCVLGKGTEALPGIGDWTNILVRKSLTGGFKLVPRRPLTCQQER